MAIEVGSKVQGKVSGITKFGAFIDLPEGMTGLVHISEIAENYVSDINEHLKVGEQVLVKVLNVDPTGKIGLSIRKAVETTERPYRSNSRPNNSKPSFNAKQQQQQQPESFDQKMSRFLKDSEDRLTSLKRSTETKRGGRGGRRG